jgi:DNA topoisomerase-1
MVIRHGRFGAFLGCEKYPDCNGIVNIPPRGEHIIELPCPAIGCNGTVVRKMSRYGKPFYSCNNFPDCDVIVNDPEDLKTKYPNHPKTPYTKKAKGGGRGKQKPNAQLAKIVGKEPLTRGQITKKMWEYIKKHHLQDPNNKRKIIADNNLGPLFGQESIDMFQLARVISQNLE